MQQRRRTRRRTRSTAPSLKYWLTAATVTYLVGTASAARVQPGRYDSAALARDPDLNDILETAVWPAVDGAAPVGYEQVLERARRQVRLEQRAEEEKRERQRLAAAATRGSDRRDDRESNAASQRTDEAARGGVRVVRETFYIPLDGESSRPDPAIRGAPPAARNATALVAEPPADFLRTVGKLRVFRPLFTYAVHHPLRFLLAYVLMPILSLAWTVLSSLFSLVLLILSPIRFLFYTFVLAPIAFAQNVISALAPLLYALSGALAIGAGLGALGGLVAAKSTRAAIERTVHTGSTALRWLGVLPKDESAARRNVRRDSATTATASILATEEQSGATTPASEMILESSSSLSGSASPASFIAERVQPPDEATAAAQRRSAQLEALRQRVKAER